MVKLIATADPSVLWPVPVKVRSSSPGVVDSRAIGTGVELADARGVARPEECAAEGWGRADCAALG